MLESGSLRWQLAPQAGNSEVVTTPKSAESAHLAMIVEVRSSIGAAARSGDARLEREEDGWRENNGALVLNREGGEGRRTLSSGRAITAQVIGKHPPLHIYVKEHDPVAFVLDSPHDFANRLRLSRS